MIIVNKEHRDAYNIKHIVNIYIASDGNTIKVAAGTATRGGILGKYKTSEIARKAFEDLMKDIEISNREVLNKSSMRVIVENGKVEEKSKETN